MRQAHTCGRVGPLAWLQVLQNSGSWMFRLRVKTLSARDRRWQNPRKQNYREHSNIKARNFSPLTFSVPRKTAGEQQRVPAPCWIRILSPDSLRFAANTKPCICINLPQKNSIWHIKLEKKNCVQDLHFLIGQVKCWGQTRYTRILHRETLIDTYFTLYIG